MMVTNAELYARVINIMNHNNFERTLRPAVEFMMTYSTEYNVMPESIQIQAATGIEVEEIPELNEDHHEWFLDHFETFTKRQELERAILKSADLLEKGEFDPVEKLIKDAVAISLQRDMGTDYFADPKQRLTDYFDSGGQMSTGWKQLDRLMYGGMNRGELSIFCGGSGSGKSLVMMNLALNFVDKGLNGVYISLELSEELTSLRTDAMLTQMSTKEIRKDIEKVELKVKMAAKKSGQYHVKSFPAQTTVNTIRAYIKELQIKTKNKIDFVMIDYLDLVMPSGIKVAPEALFIKDKYSSEELRNLSKELGCIMITASQLGRQAVDETEYDHSSIGGGISKINTSDFVFGIFTSRSMKERGKIQFQCLKSRSSQGVGMKIDLDYDVDTMRISDNSDEEDEPKPVQSIMDRFKPSKSEESEQKIVANVQSNKLKMMLNSLKSGQ
jgi:replicative DNA helicase